MKEFDMLDLGDALNEYLKEPKTFVLDAQRLREFETAKALAAELFPNANIEEAEDPLQMGAKILRIRDNDITMRDVTETKKFNDMCLLADNFEIYPTNEENLVFAAVFNGVYKRI